MDVRETAAMREEKKRRLFQNFIEDLGQLKGYFEDKSVSDIKVVGSGEIIVTRFALGKEFTGVKL